MPPLPPKTASNKIKAKDCEENLQRKAGLTKFLSMIIEHPQLCNSKLVDAFLLDSSGEQFSMGKHMHEIGGDGSQFSRAYLLECSEVFTEEKAIGDF